MAKNVAAVGRERPNAPDQGEGGTVGKALAALDAVAAFGRPVRFTEILEASDFPKATLYRLLRTLVAEGMLSHDPETGTYGLGVRLVRLAHAAWATASLAPVARPHILRLAEAVGQTVHLAELDGGQVLYLDKVRARQPVPMYSEAGKVGPAYCTGVGKAMMAFLAPPALEAALSRQSFHPFTPSTITSAEALRAELRAIRESGVAHDREEHEQGIFCVAAPVLTGTGRVLGAISITGHRSAVAPEDLEEHVPILRETAAAIGAEAEKWRFPEAGAVKDRGGAGRCRE